LAYQPIENYGIIGDMRTVALVGVDGSIDWFCYPCFDAPSVFGAILDDRKGGRFALAPSCEIGRHKQTYWPDTNVLVSRFLSPDGVAEVIDFMPVGRGTGDRSQLIRIATVVRGRMPMRMVCLPAFNYARDEHHTEIQEGGARFASRNLTLTLASSVPLERDETGVRADFTLGTGETAIFVLREDAGEGDEIALQEGEADLLFRYTVAYWRHWLAGSQYHGRWRETVDRSVLALKLLTYEPTGAIIAAPTCSLPEWIGGGRNWDYRYTWIRDAAFTTYAFLRLGFTDEASRFMEWLEARAHELEGGGTLQVMYGIDGRHDLTEETLDHLEGYRGSKPVRIGNGAFNQLQLDIYGEILDSIYLFNKYASPISYELWRHIHDLADWVAENWQRKDEGVWEVRGGAQHFVYSKLMCWVALDRALRLADKRSFPADRAKWVAARDAVYTEIMSNGWSRERHAFVQHYGSPSLDASNLMMPLVFFVSPTDPRMLSTLEATLRPPERGGLTAASLVHRYNIEESPDGLDGNEGTFNICTFWLVEALTRAGKVRPELLERARLMFERMLSYANHVGLFAEQTGSSGEALGNFPQGFTHLSLISAAVNLDLALGAKK